MSNTMALVLLLFIFLIIRVLFLKLTPSDTPAGAIVMGCGIFVNGAMKNISLLEKNFSGLSAMMLMLIWLFIGGSYASSFFQGTFHERHLKNPIKSFAVGTWVAGTSVCWIAVYQRLPFFAFAARVLFFANVLLWIFYMCVCLKNYSVLFKEHLTNRIHGVVLLAAVSTQSIVVLGSTVFGKEFPIPVSRFLLILGAAFYILGFILIIKRYFFTNSWTVEDDWQNTNCILHGAMSITGLASVVSAAVNNNLILVIWLWVLLWFVIVEVIELYRACKRIRKYGFRKGIAIYDVTQWSRIFTFGMLYTFTMRFNLALSTFSKSSLFRLKHIIIMYGKWVMVFILIVEGLLFFTYESSNRMTALAKKQE